MKKLPFIAFFILSVCCLRSPACAEDTGWLQPGVRVWYVSSSMAESDADGTSGSTANTQEADLIYAYAGGLLYVTQQQAAANWTFPMPATTWAYADHASEGLFWISPQRLRAMRVSEEVEWLHTSRIVSAKASYSSETLPFLRLLPLDALFKISPGREFVVLKNAEQTGSSAGQYFFDVETGLLCARQGLLGTEDQNETSGFSGNVLVLAEINYDFVSGRAYPEDSGPHTGFAAVLSAARYEFLNNQSFKIDSMILSRHNDVIVATITGDFKNVPLGVNYAFDYNLAYDANADLAYVLEPGAAQWRQNGDHFLWWIPPGDLALEAIKVWDLELARQASGEAVITFETQDFSVSGFPSISYDAEGYISDVTANAPNINLYIDSRSDPQKVVRVDGRDFYATQMEPAIPSDNGSTTTTMPVIPCPAAQLLSDDPASAALLREFRDTILSRTPEGREHIQLYYAHAREIAGIMGQSPAIRHAAGRLIYRLLPMISALLEGKPANPLPDVLKGIQTLCAEIGVQASPGLRAAIREFEKGLVLTSFLQSLNSIMLQNQNSVQTR